MDVFSHMDRARPSSTPGSAPLSPNSAGNRIDSDTLLSGRRELIIEHAGCEYRLRRTQNDKLILTK